MLISMHTFIADFYASLLCVLLLAELSGLSTNNKLGL